MMSDNCFVASSISSLSYNKGSNWLTLASLGFYVRWKDC